MSLSIQGTPPAGNLCHLFHGPERKEDTGHDLNRRNTDKLPTDDTVEANIKRYYLHGH